MCTDPSTPDGQEIKWVETDRSSLRTRDQRRNYEVRDGGRREVYKESERVRRGLDLRELFESPFSEKENDSESAKYGGFRAVEIRGRSEAPSTIKKAILDPRIKADSELEKLYGREPDLDGPPAKDL
ncbi:hypothetical protein TNCV_1485051 [Trichonephila clavipes]|nr:hypothetical protein TNCV_1485051 [Trichonephila clavipes]